MNKKAFIVAVFLLAIAGAAVFLLQSDSDESVETVERGGVSVQSEENPEPTPPPPQTETATYIVRFNNTWSAETHPNTFLSSAHMSPLVAVSHSMQGDVFSSGSLATDGVEEMAETGATGILESELNSNSNVHSFAKGSRIDSPGSSEVTLEFTQQNSLLTFVSMIAPSPDWFVGVESYDLFDGGVWADSLELRLNNYDAGTDSGVDFTSANADTNPAENIQGQSDEAFRAAVDEADFGTLTIIRQ